MSYLAVAQRLEDLVETAWGVIANVSGGSWGSQSEEWRAAATRWRDEWHAHLKAAGPRVATVRLMPKFPDAESLPAVNDLRIVRLRAEMWTAVQITNGNDLEHLKALVGELVQFFDVASPVSEPPPAVPWGPDVKSDIENAAIDMAVTDAAAATAIAREYEGHPQTAPTTRLPTPAGGHAAARHTGFAYSTSLPTPGSATDGSVRVPDPTTESIAERTAELVRLRAVIGDAQAASNRDLEAKRTAEAEATRLRAVLRRISEGGRHLDAAVMARDAIGPDPT